MEQTLNPASACELPWVPKTASPQDPIFFVVLCNIWSIHSHSYKHSFLHNAVNTVSYTTQIPFNGWVGVLLSHKLLQTIILEGGGGGLQEVFSLGPRGEGPQVASLPLKPPRPTMLILLTHYTNNNARNQFNSCQLSAICVIEGTFCM